MLNRLPQWIAAAVAATAGLAACGSEPGTATTGSASSSSTTSATSGEPRTNERAAHSSPRSKIELGAALLKLTDLPSGFVVEPAGAAGVDIGVASSRDPRCAPLVKLSNAKSAPGSKASTNITFSGGPSGPFIDESIDAMGSAEAVEAMQASLKSAVAACRQLTVTVPGQSAFTMKIAEVPAPRFGDRTLAVKMTVAGGPMNGLEITQVTTGVKDVVLSITFVAPTPLDVDGATMAAASKVQVVLGAATTRN